MRIVSSDVNMSSTHTSLQEYQLNENLQFQTNIPEGSTNNDWKDLLNNQDSVNISPQARLIGVNSCEEDEDLLSEKDKAKLKLIKTLMELLTGKEINFRIPKLKKSARLGNINLSAAPTRPTWGLRYDRVETYREIEQSSFSAQAIIKTADGREINASLQVNMSREFLAHNEIHIRAGNAAIDPLVINFDAPAAALGEKNFRFDLDSDGQEDQIAFLRPGSGFLALDRNEDGTINNGSELFGPSTGAGFGELAAFDEDGNGWIDEADSVFQSLRIWAMDEAGNQQLLALGEKGVGAIYLGHLTSPFSIKDAQNNSLGEVRSSGFFIRENGSMGSVQQVDLVV